MSTQAGTLVKLYEACLLLFFLCTLTSLHFLLSPVFWVQSSSGWPKAGIWACGFACCFPQTNANSHFYNRRFLRQGRQSSRPSLALLKKLFVQTTQKESQSALKTEKRFLVLWYRSPAVGGNCGGRKNTSACSLSPSFLCLMCCHHHSWYF